MFAEFAHFGQKYGKGPLDHMDHVHKVVKVVQRFFGSNELLIAGALLHDTIEDTWATYKHIKAFFGQEIADLVWNVTNEPGRNRKEKTEKTCPKIASNWESVALKCCDRIANMEHSLGKQQGLFNMYKKEYPKFKRMIHDNANFPAAEWDECLAPLWDYLDTLASREPLK